MNDKPLVYLETSFISHLTARPSRDPLYAAKQHSSQQWWENCREQFRLVVSPTVFEECRKGEPAMARQRVALLEESALLLPQDSAILEISGAFAGSGGAAALQGGGRCASHCQRQFLWL